MGFQDNKLVACARLLGEGVSYPSVSIGRVATSEAPMREAIDHCEALWPGCEIEIGAQEYLKRFYEGFGFEATSTMYLEDDIPHIDMKRSGAAKA